MKGIKRVKINSLLAIFLFLLMALEAYLVYTKLYPNLNVEENSVPTKSVVRVDIKSYELAIDMLDHLQTYVPKPVALPRMNPFKW